MRGVSAPAVRKKLLLHMRLWTCQDWSSLGNFFFFFPPGVIDQTEKGWVCPQEGVEGPPGLHTTARELQTCTFQGPGASNTTKIPQKDPKKREERKKIVAGEGKKRAKFRAVQGKGGPAEGGPGERPKLHQIQSVLSVLLLQQFPMCLVRRLLLPTRLWLCILVALQHPRAVVVVVDFTQKQDLHVSHGSLRCFWTIILPVSEMVSLGQFEHIGHATVRIEGASACGVWLRVDHWPTPLGRLRCGVLYHVANRTLSFHGVADAVQLEGTNFGQSRFHHPDLTNLGQSQFWPKPIWASPILVNPIFGSGRCQGAPKVGLKPRKGAQEVAPKGGGSPKFRAFFSLPPEISFFLLSLGSLRGISVVFETPGP